MKLNFFSPCPWRLPLLPWLMKRCGTIGVVEKSIDDLPDDVLSQILTRLTWKEIIVVSVLSKRWNKLCASHPTLDFTEYTPIEDNFIQAVDTVLRNFNGPKLNKLRVDHSTMCDTSEYPVDDWFSLAFRKGVSEIELNFSSSYPLHPDNCCISDHVFLQDPEKHFEYLTDLRLRSVNLSDQVFDNILSNCSSLERFELVFDRGLVNAKNTTPPHQKLKILKLYYCEGLERLELKAPNLVTFKYIGSERILCITDAKQLASLRLSTNRSLDEPLENAIFPRREYFITQFSSYLPMLKYLVVTASILEGIGDFAQLCVFSNLKHLTVDVDWHHFWIRLGYQLAASIIRAAPYLELLMLNLPVVDVSRFKFPAIEWASMSLCQPHQNLKEVKLLGFRGDQYMIEFITYLINNVVSLQKIDVYLHALCTLSEISFPDEEDLIIQGFGCSEDEAKYYTDCVLSLRQTLPPNVQFFFHDE